ncbi:MAG: alpha-L-arabinofuranosidase C-terminal domain-containing protein [Candidatus Sulfopaludibacter sp.]|nr:alpha-L-arabinofuranosidase C-terminal domain-containing protein [Candidatus Sulfopaludibacter sp.]
MNLSRRSFALSLAAAPSLLRAQQDNLRARVKIDTERTIGDIDPKLYGNFIEHLGRCIDGGIFEEKSPLSDANGFRKDVLDAVKKLNVTLLRWPGGNFSSNYHWADGLGPRDQRPPRLEMAWGTVESNRFGTHEFLNYVEALGTEPYICANLGTGTWTEAQQWVEYCNSKEDTAMTRLRRQNGRQAPWKVTYWGLGNEMDGPWQMGHRSAEDYGKFALEAAKLMKWTDPGVKLIAAGSSNFGPGSDWTGWNRTVLQFLNQHADYLSLHMYVGNQANDFGDFVASSVELDHRIKTAGGIIDAALSGQPGNRKIYIAWDEWNVWYRARGNQERGRRILEEHYNLEDALVVATFLNTFVNHADIVKIANMAQLVNVIAPIFSNDRGLFLQTIYYPLQLFANNTRGKALELFVDSPKYKTRRFDDVPYLDCSAGYDNGTVVLNVVNRHPGQAIETEFELEDKQFTGPVSVSVVNGPDIKSENDFGKTLVKTTEQSAAADGKKLRYRFLPHSYTMLKGKVS